MKKIFVFLALAVSMALITSCDDTTDTIGGSLIPDNDKLVVSTDSFDVSSKTIPAGNVIPRTSTGYLGKMTDAETNTQVTANFMTQFHVLDNYQMTVADSITSRDESKNIIADSCEIRLFYKGSYGDSLAQMKLTAYELNKPVEEGITYRSNFDPIANNYVRTNGGIAVNRSYTLTDLTEPDSVRKTSNYVKNINIKLNDQYTDKDGVVYNNFGTYLMRKYQSNPTAFRNSYHFLHEICPGFYFKITDGEGSMAKIEQAQINIYYRAKKGTSEKETFTKLVGTEEVLQLTNFSNDQAKLQDLIKETGHTYLKTPAGLFTQLTLPITDILAGHENDTINSAKIEVKRVNNNASSTYNFGIPQNVLMLPADSVETFFAKTRLNDNKTSFLASYNTTKNSYIFNNISGLISFFKQAKSPRSENWGKVVLVPVELQTTTTGSGASQKTTVNMISNQMGLSSTKLLGNTSAGNGLRITVVYSKFNNN
ncbi:hypothetical protein HMPREF0647_04385 [Prevotella bivia DNF00320]|uniref:Lipoprotein n=1 Tax=Prevotella bivia DNF00320 TaxID=1401068 RepID=A0A096AD37_9BACT|nr:DUF4270 domain-containing protein [Prevotella bivia]KGF45033.1 hypothetical protein HMPREF0647_04385 [Prevotella bivia DNF00320]MDU3909083.1 DUF4270 domain-containing protein [Prevotella bivia]